MVARVAPGQYTVSISGLGTGCPLPQLNPSIDHYVSIIFSGGGCGFGAFNSTVVTADGQDHYWSYMFVGVGNSSSSLRSSAERFRLPVRPVTRHSTLSRKGR